MILPDFATPSFLVVACVLCFCIGVSKSGFAAGVTTLGVPVLSIYLHPSLAAGILLPLLCGIDTTTLWRYWPVWRRDLLKRLAPGALLGIAIGALTFGSVDPAWIRLLVGGIALWFCVLFFGAGLLPKVGHIGYRWAFVFATLGGFTSHIAHAGGPPVRAYLLQLGLDKSSFVGTFGVTFGLINYGKLLPYIAQGQISWTSLTVTALLVPCVVAGILTGWYLHLLISQTAFSRLSYSLLLLAGLKLMWDGTTEIFL